MHCERARETHEEDHGEEESCGPEDRKEEEPTWCEWVVGDESVLRTFAAHGDKM